MIYVELVKAINSHKTSARDENFIQTMNNVKTKYKGNAQNRLYTHFINMIIHRLNLLTENFVSSVNDVSNTQLAIEEIKKESSYCKQLAKVNLIDEETQKAIVNYINEYLNQVEDKFKEMFLDSPSEELSLLAHNINLGGRNEL